jgi:hypothetical protein
MKHRVASCGLRAHKRRKQLTLLRRRELRERTGHLVADRESVCTAVASRSDGVEYDWWLLRANTLLLSC